MTTRNRLPRFGFVAGDPRVRREADWIEHWPSSDGRPGPWLSAGRVPSGYLLRFHDVADFEVPRGAETITVFPQATSDPGLVRHLALRQVLPRALSLESPPILHASAVSCGGAAMAIVGASRAGKSTLASALCARGCALLADDFVHVAEAEGAPRCSVTASNVWLDGDATAWLANAPRRAAPPASATPLGLVCLIDPVAEGRAASVSPMTARQALFAVFAQSYRIDPTDRLHVQREFDRVARLVTAVPARRLELPRGLAHLPGTVRLLLAELDQVARR